VEIIGFGKAGGSGERKTEREREGGKKRKIKREI
jgi:hypothetical protein